jgi:hypothetical protein
MIAHAKKMKIGVRSSTITFEHDKHGNKRDNMLQIKALYCLLGGYNEVGRNVDLDTYSEFQDKLNEVINTFKHLL